MYIYIYTHIASYIYIYIYIYTYLYDIIIGITKIHTYIYIYIIDLSIMHICFFAIVARNMLISDFRKFPKSLVCLSVGTVSRNMLMFWPMGFGVFVFWRLSRGI